MSDLRVKFKLLRENSRLPIKGTEHSACYDVFLSKVEEKDGVYICYLGFKTEIPKGHKGVLVPRSSLSKTMLVMQNSPGQIDSDFRGEYQIRFRMLPYGYIPEVGCDLNYCIFPFSIGDRIGQLYFEKVLGTEFEVVEELEGSERGEGGFGSTGK